MADGEGGEAADAEEGRHDVDRHDPLQRRRPADARVRRPADVLRRKRRQARQGRRHAGRLRLRRGGPRPERPETGSEVRLPERVPRQALQQVGTGAFVQHLAAVGRGGRSAAGDQPDRPLHAGRRPGHRQRPGPPDSARPDRRRRATTATDAACRSTAAGDPTGRASGRRPVGFVPNAQGGQQRGRTKQKDDHDDDFRAVAVGHLECFGAETSGDGRGRATGAATKRPNDRARPRADGARSIALARPACDDAAEPTRSSGDVV